MMNDKVVDSSLVILGVLQVYSMFLPDVSNIADSDTTTIRREEITATTIVAGLAIIACFITKNAFPLWVAGLTAIAYIGLVEYRLRQGCGCGDT